MIDDVRPDPDDLPAGTTAEAGAAAARRGRVKLFAADRSRVTGVRRAESRWRRTRGGAWLRLYAHSALATLAATLTGGLLSHILPVASLAVIQDALWPLRMGSSNHGKNGLPEEPRDTVASSIARLEAHGAAVPAYAIKNPIPDRLCPATAMLFSIMLGAVRKAIHDLHLLPTKKGPTFCSGLGHGVFLVGKSCTC